MSLDNLDVLCQTQKTIQPSATAVTKIVRSEFKLAQWKSCMRTAG